MRKVYTNGVAFQMLTALDAAANETGMLGFAIAKNRRKIKNELEEYIERRNEIIQAHTSLNESGSPCITEEDAATANAELAPYIAMECIIDVSQIPEDVFYSGGLTAQQMYDLDFMVLGNEEPSLLE